MARSEKKELLALKKSFIIGGANEEREPYGYYCCFDTLL